MSRTPLTPVIATSRLSIDPPPQVVAATLADISAFVPGFVTTTNGRRLRQTAWPAQNPPMSIATECRSAVRAIRSRPATSAVSLATTALVVGAGSAVLAVVSATLLRPLPFPGADRLVWVYGQPPSTTEASQRNPIHSTEFVQFRARVHQLAGLAGIWSRQRALQVEGEAESVATGAVSANYFDVLGVRAAAGRVFSAAEDEADAHVAVVSEPFAVRRFGSSEAALGRQVIVDGEAYEIIGVLPRLPVNPIAGDEIYTPLHIDPGHLPLPASTIVFAIGRLAAGATPASTTAEIEGVMRDVVAATPALYSGWSSGAMPMHEALYGDTAPALMLLLAAVGALALIACANLANVTIADVTGRRDELALRAALGAGRGGLMRLFAIEGALLGLAGAVCGVLLSGWCLPAVLALDPGGTASLGDVAVDWRVLAGALAITFTMSVLSGVLPAALVTRGDLARGLAQGGRRTAGSRPQRRMRAWLVGAEVLLAAVLLTTSALLLTEFARTIRIAPGFDPTHVLGTRVRLPQQSYPTIEARARFVSAVLDEVRALPGVVDAGITDISFRFGGGYNTAVSIDGRPSPTGSPYTVQFRRVGPRYFSTMRIAHVQGRAFHEADDSQAQPVAIVSDAFARRFWPGDTAIGRRVLRASDPTHPLTVVGVVADVHDRGLGLAPAPTIYIAFAQNNTSAAPVSLVVRT